MLTKLAFLSSANFPPRGCGETHCGDKLGEPRLGTSLERVSTFAPVIYYTKKISKGKKFYLNK